MAARVKAVAVGDTPERIKEATALRAAGASYQEIADTLGISRHWARELVLRALDAARVEGAEQMRAMEGARLDRLQRAYWPQALNGDRHAAALILRISQRRAELFGLDAPAKVEATVTLGTEAIDARMEELRQRLAVAS